MTAVTYTALRAITAGHAAATQYSMDLHCTEITPASTPNVEQSETLDGSRETLRFFSARYYDVTLASKSGTQLALIEEFLRSVEAGEQFAFDPYGSANTPVAPVTADLESKGYSLPRWSMRGQGGANDPHTVQFRVRCLV